MARSFDEAFADFTDSQSPFRKAFGSAHDPAVRKSYGQGAAIDLGEAMENLGGGSTIKQDRKR